MKKIKKYLIILLIVFVLSGCTQRLTTVEKNPKGKETKITVVYSKGKDATGQALTKNILCKPKDKELVKLYEKNKVDINKLPDCKEFKLSLSNKEGIWENIFVRPLAWVILEIGGVVKNFGLAVIIASILIRLILYPFTKSTSLQSEKMKEAKPELDDLEKKYKDKKDDQKAMMEKSQEMMAIYKKHNISLFSGCLFGFIQLPLFIAFLEAINRVPAIFEGSFLGFKLGMTPGFGITHGHYQYFILVALIIATTYFSFKITGITNNKKDNKEPKANQTTDMMMKVMIIVIGFSSFSLSTAIGIYWIFSSLFTIVQSIIVKKGGKHGTKKA